MDIWPRHRGGKELKGYLSGKSLTRNQAIQAKCYDCMGRYDDGAEDCQIKECPLYSFMPYRGKK